MFHEIKSRKDIKYSKLNDYDIFLTLCFEGVVPTRAWGFPDLNYQCFKGYRDLPVAGKCPASSTIKSDF